MLRFPDWPQRLDRFLIENREHPFRYGSFDCCLFVCEAIRVMTGTDIGAPFRGRYGTRREALGVAHEHSGTRSVEAVVERVTCENSMPEVAPLMAGRGDVILMKRRFGCSLGIVALNGREIVGAGDGLIFLPMDRAAKAWRV